MTTATSSPKPDHDALRQLVERLEEETNAHRPTLFLRLAELRELLGAHFAAEEGAGGLFELVKKNAPWEEERVQTLEAEHAALLSSIDFLQRRVTFLTAEERVSEVRCFVQLLRAHEITEGLLFQTAMAGTACA